MRFRFYKQLNAMDCGPTCLRMVAGYYGRHYNIDGLRQSAGYSKEGVSLLGVSEAAEKIGFHTRGVQLTFEQLEDAQFPCILHWDQNHFVVMLRYLKRGKVLIADPAKNIISYTRAEFLTHWASKVLDNNEAAGTALLLEPTAGFYDAPGEKEHKLHWSVVLQYLRHSRWQIAQVFMALLIVSFLQLLFPFLTQSIVDTGIN